MTAENREPRMDESELLDITRNDPARARMLRNALEDLAGGGSGAMKEMAQEVLSGRIGLRQASTISAYAEPLIEKLHDFQNEWNSLSDEERETRIREGERIIDERRAEFQAGSTVSSGGTTARARHDSKGWSLY